MTVPARRLLPTGCCLLGLVLLTAGAAHAAELRPPVVAANAIATPPTIDGVVDPAEWSQATVLDGFEVLMNRTAPRDRTRALVAWDSTTLYLAVQCATAPGVPPKADHTERDSTVFLDDAIEVFCEGRQFVGNSRGTVFDAAGAASAWNGEWSYRARRTETGWEGEFALPFATLGRTSPRAGETLNILVGRDSALPEMEYSQWSYCASYWPTPGQAGTIVLAQNLPQVRLTKLLARGTSVDVGLEAVAAAGGPSQVTVRAVLRRVPDLAERRAAAVHANVMVFEDPAGGEVVGQAEQTVDLAAGAVVPVRLPAMPTEKGNYALELRASDGSGTVLLDQRVPLAVTPTLSVEVRRFPTAGVMEVTAVTARTSLPQAVARVLCTLRDAAGTTLWEDAKDAGQPFRFDRYRELPDDSYTLTVVARGAQGDELARDVTHLRKSPPPWLNNDLGKEATVIPPWTPVRVSAPDQVEVWGRTYRFDAVGLPRTILTGGSELLAAPVRLVGEAGGVPLIFAAEGLPLVEAGDAITRLSFSASVQGRPDLRLSITHAIEFDGFVWTELTLTGPAGASLDRLRLEVPLRRDHARYYLPVYNKSANIPAAGLAAPVVTAQVYPGEPAGLYWVGDEDRGLVLAAEDDRGWQAADPARAQILAPQGDQMVWEMHFADRRVEVSPAWKLAFCWYATPAKPVEHWYAHRVVGDGGYSNAQRDQPSPVTLAWPAEKLIDPAQGALEIDAVCLFDWDAPAERVVDSANNRAFFGLSNADDGGLGCFWAADARTLVVAERYGAQDRSRLYGPWRPALGQGFRFAFVWGESQELSVDGKRIAGHPARGLRGVRPGTMLTLGGDKSQWLIVAVKLSRAAALSPTGPLQADASTALLQVFDRPEALAPGAAGLVASAGLEVAERYGQRGALLDSFAAPLSGTEVAYRRGIRVMHIHEPWTEIMGYPGTFTHTAELHALMAEAHRVGMHYALYSQNVISTLGPEFAEWGAEWALSYPMKASFSRTPPQDVYYACHGTSWTDFYVWGWTRLVREEGVNGMYLDGTYWPGNCLNPYHAHAHFAADGTARPTVPIRAAREFMKRLRRATRAVDPTFFLLGHGNGPFTGHFLDCGMSGENYWVAPPNFEVPLDHWRVIYSRQWGSPMEFYTGPIVAEPYAIPLALLHGIGVWGRTYGPLFQAYKQPILNVWERYGIEQAEFVGYWRGSPLVTSSSPDVLASYHRRPGSVLLAIASPKREPPEATITVDLAGLGLDPARLLVTTGSGAALPAQPVAEAGRLRFRFPAETNPWSQPYIWLRTAP
jgi:hypothetical protein